MKRHVELAGVVCLSILLSLVLLYARVELSSTQTYMFLIWNLFLAAMPLFLSSLLVGVDKMKSSKLLFGGLLISWLLFFPNAPYILTDLFRLRKRVNIPLWYDLILLISFAWNGLVLGFISLKQIHGIVQRRMGVVSGWISVVGALGLSSFGIYLGRYLRWNSWDILAQPQGLLLDITDRILNPLSHPKTFGVTLLFTAFLFIAYLTISVLMKNERRDHIAES